MQIKGYDGSGRANSMFLDDSAPDQCSNVRYPSHAIAGSGVYVVPCAIAAVGFNVVGLLEVMRCCERKPNG